jgi:hypothetical protein
LITTGADDYFLALDYDEFGVAAITFNSGDLNRSGDETPDEDDIPAFALALTNPAGYWTQFGASAKNAGDFDGDGDCDVDDIDEFKDMFPAMSIAEFQYLMAQALSVPEPGTAWLLLTSLCFAGRLIRTRRMEWPCSS